MDDLQEIYAGFSHFDYPDSQGLVQTVLGARWQRALIQLVRAIGYPAGRYPHITKVLDTAIACETLNSAHPLLTLIELTTRNSKPHSQKSIVEIALLATLHGAMDAWHFTFDQPVQLLVGYYLLDGVVNVEVAIECGSPVVSFQLEAGCQYDLLLSPENGSLMLHPIGSDGILHLPTVQLDGRQIALVPSELVPQDLLQRTGAMVLPSRQTLAGLHEYIARAVQVLDEVSHNIASWVSSGITFLGGVRCANGMYITSSSAASYLGLVILTADDNPILTGELFIHESSHQIFNVAKSLAPMLCRHDEQLYYSALARCHRPIERVLMAYHALGNIFLYYKCCIQSGLDTEGFCEQRLLAAKRGLAEMEKGLFQATSLSSLGTCILTSLQIEIEQKSTM